MQDLVFARVQNLVVLSGMLSLNSFWNLQQIYFFLMHECKREITTTIKNSDCNFKSPSPRTDQYINAKSYLHPCWRWIVLKNSSFFNDLSMIWVIGHAQIITVSQNPKRFERNERWVINLITSPFLTLCIFYPAKPHSNPNSITLTTTPSQTPTPSGPSLSIHPI